MRMESENGWMREKEVKIQEGTKLETLYTSTTINPYCNHHSSVNITTIFLLR
jgi:CTP synthase (UTP-ammonia lyase)